jgi:hypothetical protein
MPSFGKNTLSRFESLSSRLPFADDVALPDLRHLRDLSERRRRALERPQLVEQPIDLLRREAGADIPGVHELVTAVVGENE